MNRIDMFRLPVYEFRNAAHEQYKEYWKNYIKEDHYITDKGITLTNPNLHKDWLFKPLSDFFGNSMATVLTDIGMPVDFAFTSMWGTHQTEQGQHWSHTHGNSLFSGIYYLSADDWVDAGTVFENVLADFNSIQMMRAASGPEGTLFTGSTFFNSRHQTFFEEGKLVIFPSFLRHRTKPYSGKERVVVSFNIMPIGHTQIDPLARYFYPPLLDQDLQGDGVKKWRG